MRFNVGLTGPNLDLRSVNVRYSQFSNYKSKFKAVKAKRYQIPIRAILSYTTAISNGAVGYVGDTEL